MIRPESVPVSRAAAAAVLLVIAAAVVPAAVAQGEEQETPAETPQEAEAPKITYQSAKVAIDGKAQADGVLTMVFQPQGGEAKKIRVNVLIKARAAEIAEDLAKEIAFAAGQDYKVKGSGKVVTIKIKNKKIAPFSLVIEEQSLTGVSVSVGK